MAKTDQERYSDMKKDIDTRDYEWFFFCMEYSTGQEKTFVSVLDKLTDQPAMGPSVIACHQDQRGGPAHDFMSVPLRFVNKTIPRNVENCLHFVATSSADTVWLRHAYSIIEGGQMDTTPPFLAVCVHRAERRGNTGHAKVTVGIDAVVMTDLLAYYEHPANSRLLNAMVGNELPEWSAVMFGGRKAVIGKPLHEMFRHMDELYDSFETGNTEYNTLRRDIGEFFLEDLKNDPN